jgi:septum site-determining protein MinD
VGRTVVVTSGKGGVGKTTTVANVGCALALRGRKVVLIDANFGLRNLDMILGLEGRIRFDLGDVVSGKCVVEQAMVKDERAGELYLISAPEWNGSGSVTSEQLSEVCDRLKQEFDYVIVDSPNGLETGFRVALAPADEAILVATPEVSAVCNADRVIGLLQKAGIPKPSLVLNRVQHQMVRRGDMLRVEDIWELLELPLVGLIPEHDEVVIATNRGAPVALRNRSWCGNAFREVAARLEGEGESVRDASAWASMIAARLKPLAGVGGARRKAGLKWRLVKGAPAGLAKATNEDQPT